jgi:CRISPR-associated protein Csb1
MLVAVTHFENLGATLQPPSFKDVGHGVYTLNGKTNVILHTHQATANLLESLLLDNSGQKLRPELSGIPLLTLLNQDGQYLANTLTLPHRLASSYILGHKDLKDYAAAFEKDLQGANRLAAVFNRCPFSVLFGSWFSRIDSGKAKLPRLIQGEIVAHDCAVVPTGGALHDPIVPSGADIDLSYFSEGKGSEQGIGNLPYYTEAYVSEDIQARWILHTQEIERLPLEAPQKALLIALGQYLIRLVEEKPIRLRSGCSLLAVGSSEVKYGDLPTADDLKQALPALIAACNFSQPEPLRITLKPAGEKQEPKSRSKSTSKSKSAEAVPAAG